MYLLGLGRLVAETLDERLNVLDFALLVLVSRALHVHTFLAQTDIIGIRHFIIINLAVRDFHRADGDVVQKSAVVRNHQYRAVIGLQEAFQPLNGLNVKVIGGFVQKQKVRLFQQDFGQFHAHLPTVTELAHGSQHIFMAKTQAHQNPLGLALDGVAAKQGQTVVEVVQLHDKFLILRAFIIGALGQLLLQLLRIALQLVVFVKSGKSLVQNGFRAVHVLFLWQISDGNTLRNNHIAF